MDKIMTSKEIDEAMKNRAPVFYNGDEYRRILEYVSWYDDNGKRRLSVVLLAKQGNYSVRVPADKVEAVNK